MKLPEGGKVAVHNLWADGFEETETGALRVLGGEPEGSIRAYAKHQWVSYAESAPPEDD